MKKYVIILMLMYLVSVCSAVSLDTEQPTAILIKVAEANDTALDVNTTSWTYAKSWTEIPKRFNALKVMFYASEPNDPNGETLDPNDCEFNYKIYVADYGGSGQLIADGNAIVGAMQLSHNPVSLVAFNSGAISNAYCWVDTLGTITADWNGTTGVISQNDGGGNGAASIKFDRESGRNVTCIITGRTSDYLHVYCIAYGY